MTDHIAWLLNADGTVTKVVAARRSVWPGSAYIVLEDGTSLVVEILNLLSRDDLDQRYQFTAVAR